MIDDTGSRSNIPVVLSFVVTLGFLGILVGLLGGWLSTGGDQYITLMLGSLGAAFLVVINYNLGSNIESGRKTDIIAKSVPIETIKEIQTKTTDGK